MDEQFNIPRWEELPNVDLYLDQVVTLINNSLSPFMSSNINNEKKGNQILTKTMINNYVKNKLIEAPIKKKYSKLQLAKLLIICILKQVYSMMEINNLINIELKKIKMEIAYNRFCEQFEKALKCTYDNKEFTISESTTNNERLLKAVLFSCTYKIYVQNNIKTKKEIN